MIVDHDVYFIDMVSDALIVFDGEPENMGVHKDRLVCMKV